MMFTLRVITTYNTRLIAYPIRIWKKFTMIMIWMHPRHSSNFSKMAGRLTPPKLPSRRTSPIWNTGVRGATVAQIVDDFIVPKTLYGTFNQSRPDFNLGLYLLLTRLLGIGQPQQVNSSIRAGGFEASVCAAISFPTVDERLFGYPASFIERR